MDRKTVRKYIRNGVQAPRYGPRAPRPCVVDPFVHYVTERVREFPDLSVKRLLREIRAMGYTGEPRARTGGRAPRPDHVRRGYVGARHSSRRRDHRADARPAGEARRVVRIYHARHREGPRDQRRHRRAVRGPPRRNRQPPRAVRTALPPVFAPARVFRARTGSTPPPRTAIGRWCRSVRRCCAIAARKIARASGRSQRRPALRRCSCSSRRANCSSRGVADGTPHNLPRRSCKTAMCTRAAREYAATAVFDGD